MARLWNHKFRQLTWDGSCLNWDIFQSPDLLELKLIFSMENELFSKIENLSTCYSIFYKFRSWPSFFPDFWIIKWILQPLTTNHMSTTLKIKKPHYTCTPCIILTKEPVKIGLCLSHPYKSTTKDSGIKNKFFWEA